MNNKLKLLVSSMLAVGLVACWTDVGGNAKQSKPLQKVSQNESNNLATVQSDAKGGVVISNIPSVSNQDVVIKLIPVDASNEGRYIEYSLPRIAESGPYSSSDGRLMPHRKYGIRITGLNQGESLKLSFKKDEALSDVASASVPNIFSGVMTRAGVFNGNLYVRNGELYYATNGQNNISNIPVLNNNVITPFYAGNINIVNESGDSVAQVKVGEYTNPVFENDLVPNAKHPLLDSPYINSKGYKFSVSDGNSSGIGVYSLKYTQDDPFAPQPKWYTKNFKNPIIQKMIPDNVRKSEGRYWPNNLFISIVDNDGNRRLVKYFLLGLSAYSKFTTTLPVPIDFVVASQDGYRQRSIRYCTTNIFYSDDLDQLEPYPFKRKNEYSDYGPGSVISKDTWSAANCFGDPTNSSDIDRRDVGEISDYNYNSDSRNLNRSLRIAW